MLVTESMFTSSINAGTAKIQVNLKDIPGIWITDILFGMVTEHATVNSNTKTDTYKVKNKI